MIRGAAGYGSAMRTIVIPADGPAPEQTAYVAVPVPTGTSPGPWPGVVVVHEGPGPTHDMQEQCDWLAAAGYLAVMPDLYDGRSMVRCIKGVVRQMFAQSGPFFDRLDAARVWLAGREDCTGSVGVIGFCLGGGFALLLAGRPGYDAAALNYSPLPKNLDEVLAGACPVVASFGGKDRTLNGAAAKVDLVLEGAGVPHDVKEYPNARHAFFSRYVVPSPITTIAKIAGVGYDHDSTADAKRRILAWFDRYLRPSSA
jgi:carboxymethylenebutenolidase